MAGPSKPKLLPPGGPLRSSAGEKNTKNESLLTRRARAANFIVEIANGASILAIAERWQLSRETVRAELRWAEQQGFYEQANDALRNRIVPLALDVMEKALKKHLESGDWEAAEKILRGVRLLNPNADRINEAQKALDAGADEISWERFTAKRALTRQNDPPASEGHPPGERREGNSGGDPETIEAEVIEVDREASVEGGQSADAGEVDFSAAQH